MWISEPPVVEITRSEVGALCRQFLVEMRRLERPASEDWLMWEDRKSWAEREANNLRFETGSNAELTFNYTYCVYKHSGKPVGLMEWWNGLNQGVAMRLAMLPGRENECAILVEHAVNLSEEAGHEGRVYFSAFNTAGRRRYSPRWLQSDVVNPSESEKWVKLGDKWRLKEYLLNDWRRYTIGRETFGTIHPQPYRF
jgi:hypothetical protein